MREKRTNFFSSTKNHKILFGVRNSEDIQYLQSFQMRFSKTIKMVICGACGQCRECLDRKLTNACPLSNPRISRQASLRYLCNYMKRWNTWPLTRFSLHVFSQLNWLATDIRKKKSVKKIWKKSRVERGHDFSVTEEVVHSILWCTQSTYTKQWQTDSSSRNELKDWTIVLQFLQMNIKRRLTDCPYL